MRALAVGFVLALAACASTITTPFSSADLRGCWIEQRADGVTWTQRWFPERGGWRGDQLTYFRVGDPEHSGFRLERGREGWQLCPLDDGMPHGPPCRAVATGGTDYFARVDASAERLRIAWVDEGQETVMFDGARDGCD